MKIFLLLLLCVIAIYGVESVVQGQAPPKKCDPQCRLPVHSRKSGIRCPPGCPGKVPALKPCGPKNKKGCKPKPRS